MSLFENPYKNDKQLSDLMPSLDGSIIICQYSVLVRLNYESYVTDYYRPRFDMPIYIINALDAEDVKVISDNALDCYVIPVSEKELENAVMLVNNLRDNAFSVDMDYTNKKMNAKFKEADRYNAKFIVIIGEDEIKNNKLTIKDNLTKEEVKIERDNLIDYLDVNI